MIAVDTNLLVYAHREDSPWHEQAAAKLAELAEGAAPWAIGIARQPRLIPRSSRIRASIVRRRRSRSPSTKSRRGEIAESRDGTETEGCLVVS